MCQDFDFCSSKTTGQDQRQCALIISLLCYGTFISCSLVQTCKVGEAPAEVIKGVKGAPQLQGQRYFGLQLTKVSLLQSTEWQTR